VNFIWLEGHLMVLVANRLNQHVRHIPLLREVFKRRTKVGQASRLPSERFSASINTYLRHVASTAWVGETPAFTLARLRREAQTKTGKQSEPPHVGSYGTMART
jgi:hypothetical protein